MDKIFHVFVSSTYADLKDERKKVSEAIAKAGFVPEGMELFPASSQKQFEFIKRVIDRCDYYVLIIGGRYGSLADSNISYTEMEYDYALERGISVLALLHHDPDKIEAGKSEKLAENIERLKRFRERVSKGALIDFWSNADELSMKVVVALGQEATLNSGVGWVRGNQAIDPAVYQELESVRKERDLLREKLSSENFSFPTWLPEVSQIKPVTLRHAVINQERKETIFEKNFELELSWSDIFQASGGNFFSEVPAWNVVRVVTDSILNKYVDADEIPQDVEQGYLNSNIQTTNISIDFETIRDSFIGYGWVQTSIRNSSHGGSYSAFELTDFGKRYLAYLNSLTREQN